MKASRDVERPSVRVSTEANSNASPHFVFGRCPAGVLFQLFTKRLLQCWIPTLDVARLVIVAHEVELIGKGRTDLVRLGTRLAS